MSYLVSIEITQPTEVFSDNYTSNCGDMFRAAIGQDGIWTLEGLKTADVLSQLERACAHMADPKNREFYESMNPKNGWGNYEGALEFLQSITEACRQNPDGIIRLWA